MSASVSLCAPDQFYLNGACQACEVNQGTYDLQATECIPCEDMWFESQNDPNSIEYVTSFEICSDPEAIYRS